MRNINWESCVPKKSPVERNRVKYVGYEAFEKDSVFSKVKKGGFVKSAICKAHEPWKAEAYFLYVEPLRNEVQRSRWTYYEAVKKGEDLRRSNTTSILRLQTGA